MSQKSYCPPKLKIWYQPQQILRLSTKKISGKKFQNLLCTFSNASRRPKFLETLNYTSNFLGHPRVLKKNLLRLCKTRQKASFSQWECAVIFWQISFVMWIYMFTRQGCRHPKCPPPLPQPGTLWAPTGDPLGWALSGRTFPDKKPNMGYHDF